MSQASPLHPLPLSTPSTEPAHSEGWRLYCFHPQGNRKPKSAWQQGDSKPSYRVWLDSQHSPSLGNMAMGQVAPG